MVVMRLPASIAASVMQARTRRPSTCTVQAPHSPRSQPFFVPVSPNSSRKASSSVVRGSTAIVRGSPLTVRFTAGGSMRGLLTSVPPGGSRSWRPPSCDVGCADALQREPVADALIDDAAQLLGQRDARVAGRERRQLGEAFGNLARAGQQLVGRDDLVDGAPFLRGLGIELLAREDEVK